MEELQTPLMTALAALATFLTTYHTKIKKHIKRSDKDHEYLHGDADKKGLIRRLREVEAAVDDLDTDDLDLNTIILAQQAAIKEALIPVYKQLDKKADQELFKIQVEHLMEAIERIGRGN